MITEQALPSEQEVVKRLQPYLQQFPLNGVVLVAVEPAVRREENWYYVPVQLNTDAPRTYQYYDHLTDIEDEFQQKEHLNVLLVPAN